VFQREEVETQLPDMYSKIGIGTMTWSPLACGILTGKYETGIPVQSRAALKVNKFHYFLFEIENNNKID